MNHFALRQGAKIEADAERERLRRSLRCVIDALQRNASDMDVVGKKIRDGAAVFDLGLDVTTWEVVRDELVPLLRSPRLRSDLALHFSRVKQADRLSAALFEYSAGVASSLGRAPVIRKALVEALFSQLSKLAPESSDLAKKCSLAVPEARTDADE